MLTALKRQDDIVSALQLGAADYLPKPFNPDELVARLARLAPVEAT
jgi:DNA-binding response OmpR family regulator